MNVLSRYIKNKSFVWGHIYDSYVLFDFKKNKKNIIAALVVFSILMIIGCKEKGNEQMSETTGTVTMKGDELTLIGNKVEVGDDAPSFTVTDNNLNPVKLENYSGKIKIISVVPSLDTGVCDKQTRTFNEKASALGDNVVVLTISMDLPFAQSRWCGAAGVKNVLTLSDFNDASFGTGYGVLIKEMRLLTRAVFIIDNKDKIRYKQIVDEITNEPDYEAVMDKLKEIKG